MFKKIVVMLVLAAFTTTASAYDLTNKFGFPASTSVNESNQLSLIFLFSEQDAEARSASVGGFDVIVISNRVVSVSPVYQ